MNVPALNYLLRSEIYVSEDGQLRAAHLVLGYQPLSNAFQAIGHAIRAGSPRLARIDVSRTGFLAEHDLPPVVLPGVRDPYLAEQLPPPNEPGVAVQAEEETESSRLSLEDEIDEFYFEEEVQQTPLVELSDPEGERDRHSAVGVPSIVICSDDTSEEETQPMAGKGKSLKELMASRGKGQPLKGQSSKAPTPPQGKALPPVAPADSSDPGLKANPDLKKKRPADTPEEGEVAAQPTKQQKTTRAPRSRRGNSSESRDEENPAEVRAAPRVWGPRLELDGVAIPYNASIREYNRGRAGYVAEALEQPLLLPRDMEAYRRFSQPEIFLSLKRDLAMVSNPSTVSLIYLTLLDFFFFKALLFRS